ncbi:IclR family transcriptional regulator [Cupriavidus plantarum]|uniref:IclR family transcriptional regulator n=1 Tax=Cupriavidus plantarum TaxID=942865 RepID=UPI0015C80385|nr:IclR family transcriptional regulator [Cupriavidus plantarum]NYI00930.1 DNA-binding IclR family transcriptional regulator [Cupriavidus plantarum]
MKRNVQAASEMESADKDNIIAVTRALQILEAFSADDTSLTLSELSRRVGMGKSTVLRTARTLARSEYLVQREDGQWRLGAAAGWLGARYQAAFRVNETVEPVLRRVSDETRESAAFYVREGDTRACLVRVEGPGAVRHHVRVGERLSLTGAPGRVLRAFAGDAGDPYETIRKDGFYISMGEREPEVSSLAVPVFGINWTLAGALCISGPISRLTREKLATYVDLMLAAGKEVSYAISGSRDQAVRPTTWHP